MGLFGAFGSRALFFFFPSAFLEALGHIVCFDYFFIWLK